MFNRGRWIGFMWDPMMPPKRGGHAVTISIDVEWDEEHKEPTVEGLIEKLDCMLQPLIDMEKVDVKEKWNKQIISVGDYEITRPKPEEIEVEVVDIEPIDLPMEEIAE